MRSIDERLFGTISDNFDHDNASYYDALVERKRVQLRQPAAFSLPLEKKKNS